ncbi:MAG: hypothetical protein LWX55_12190 [Deltaproteobacteria bacterium]|jgi:type IV pilus assembly protein PilY1|nr:hypothetical protein [Deltaproteobacteria bacterium]
MKKTSTGLNKVFVLMTLMALWSLPAAASDMNCETPPFVCLAAPSNVMIIMDNSASMNEVIYHSSYDPATTYTGTYTSTKYRYAGTYETRTIHYNGHDADLLYGPGDDSCGVRYSPNYMNWVFFHATDEERSNLPQETRMQVARNVVSDIVKDTEDTIRFGIMKFNDNEGGTVVGGAGNITTDNIDTYLDQIEARGWTPLAETLLETWFYFAGGNKCYGGSGTYTSPIDYWCQKNFVILVTDGEPTYDELTKSCASPYRSNWDGDDEAEVNLGSDGYPYLDDIAWYMYHNDARDDLEDVQNVVTYTIGFSLGGWGADLLADTAENGDGQYLTASNASSLTDSLRQAIHDIIRRMSAGSAVAVLSTSEQDSGRFVRARFMPGSWKGYVGAYGLPYDSSNTPLWDAGYLLQERDEGNRDIFTFFGGNHTDFDSSNISLKTDLSLLWEVSTDEAANIIEYIRGESAYEGAAYRERNDWKLGDIVHSTPVIVGPPAHCYTENDYRSFRNANSEREKVVYVGANDGMLHAFRISDGKELWAYIPGNLWEKLKHLTDPEYCHEYFVDLSPKVVDVYNGTGWKTLLIGGERGGGGTYFAIDVTDPDNPVVLWEFEHENLGETWSIPAVGKIKDGSDDKWAAFVGSGFDNTDTKGYMFVIDVLDGSLLWHGNVSDDVNNCLTSPTAIDRCGDGYIDTVYAGDLKGKIWRLDVPPTNVKKWSSSLLFHAVDDGVDQPVTARPVVSSDEDSNPLIYFGTGKFYDTHDKTIAGQQTFYCIIDHNLGEIYKDSELANQTTPSGSISGYKGWYINLASCSPSERVTSEAAVVAGVVLFTSFIPDDDPCAYGRTSYLWAVNYLTGGPGDALLENPEEEDERKKSLGQGVPSAPVVSLRNSQAIIQTSGATIHIENVNLPNLGVRLRSWREAIF